MFVKKLLLSFLSALIATTSLSIHIAQADVMFRSHDDFYGSPSDYTTGLSSDLDTRERFLERVGHRMSNLPHYPTMLAPVADSLRESRLSLLTFALEKGQLLTGTATLSMKQSDEYALHIADYVSDKMGVMYESMGLDTPYEEALEAIAFLSESTYLLEMMDEALPYIHWVHLRHYLDSALGNMANITTNLQKNTPNNGLDPKALGALQSELIATMNSRRTYQQSHRNFTAIGIKLEDVLRTYNLAAPATGEVTISPSTYIKDKKAVIKNGMRCWPVNTDRSTPFYLCIELKKKKRKQLTQKK